MTWSGFHSGRALLGSGLQGRDCRVGYMVQGRPAGLSWVVTVRRPAPDPPGLCGLGQVTHPLWACKALLSRGEALRRMPGTGCALCARRPLWPSFHGSTAWSPVGLGQMWPGSGEVGEREGSRGMGTCSRDQARPCSRGPTGLCVWGAGAAAAPISSSQHLCGPGLVTTTRRQCRAEPAGSSAGGWGAHLLSAEGTPVGRKGPSTACLGSLLTLQLSWPPALGHNTHAWGT